MQRIYRRCNSILGLDPELVLAVQSVMVLPSVAHIPRLHLQSTHKQVPSRNLHRYPIWRRMYMNECRNPFQNNIPRHLGLAQALVQAMAPWSAECIHQNMDHR